MKVSLRAVVTFTFNKGTASFQAQSHGQGKPPFTDYWAKASILCSKRKGMWQKRAKEKAQYFFPNTLGNDITNFKPRFLWLNETPKSIPY